MSQDILSFFPEISVTGDVMLQRKKCHRIFERAAFTRSCPNKRSKTSVRHFLLENLVTFMTTNFPKI